MTDPAIREPEQIHQDTARKLRHVRVSDHFQAIIGCLRRLAQRHSRRRQVAELDGDEVGYLVPKVAEIKRQK